MALSVTPAREVVVRAPLFVPRDELAEFVKKQVPWILRRLEAVPPEPVLPRLVADGDRLSYLGQPFRLELRRARRVSVSFDGRALRIAAPELEPERIHAAVVRWYASRAAAAVTEAVARWAPVVGRTPTRLAIRDQKRRWGSCSGKDAISINWRCVAMDPALLDYVVVHELCHLIEHNHSPRFWAEVERVMPGYRTPLKTLKAIRPGFPFDALR